MLRVLVLSTRFPDRLRPNFGIFIERQCQELARSGVGVEIVAPIGRGAVPGAARELDALPSREERGGLVVHRPRFLQLPWLAPTRPLMLTQAVRRLGAGLHEDAPFDAISAEFSWPEGPAAVALGRRLNVPVTIKARGMEFERRAAGSTARRLLDSCRAAQGLLAVSADVKARMVAAGLPAERISVHYPAVDTVLFRPGDRAAAKGRLGVEGPLLLCVGNLIPEKGHGLAVEALARIEGATLLIAGIGPEHGALLARAAALGVADRVRFAGSIPHPLLPAFYAAADVTIHPSLVEGFGNVRLESLACGVPLVTTAAGDARILLDRPSAGRVVAADASAIADAAKSLLADPPAPARVRETVATFTWERHARELEGHLARLAAAFERRPARSG